MKRSLLLTTAVLAVFLTVVYTDTAESATVAGVYVAQSATGSGNGTDCGDARSVAFFNTPGNWGAGKPIAPGTVVRLCGTIRTELTFQGSGSAGNPITVLFMPGAKISLPTCSCFDASGSRRYLTIDGGRNGLIEATDNGVGLGHRRADRAIDMQGCSNCTVRNLTIANIFVMSPQSSDPINHTQSNAIYADGDNFTAKNNVIHDVGWAIYDNNGTNLRLEDNDIFHMDHGISLSGSGSGPVFIDGNHIHDMGNWDCGGGCHHDGIHCYTVADGSANHYGGGIYIYNNRFDGTVGSDNTSWLFLESNTGSGATPCADATTSIYIFNNYAKPSDHQLNNGVFTPASGKVFAYNNTLAGYSPANNGGYVWDCCAGHNGPGAFENNILTTAGNFGGWTASLFDPIDYNLYANASGSGSARWGCDGLRTNAFSTFQRACGDKHGAYVSNARLSSDGVPQAGSRALGAGAVLASLCTGRLAPLCYDINGALRPLRMSPDAGAYQRETAAIGARSIGRVQIGEARSSVEAFYGANRAARVRSPLFGVLRLRGDVVAATYRIHRGLLSVAYASGKVVGVATTSRYYTTRGGFGVGGDANESGLRRNGWHTCAAGLVRRRGVETTGVRTAGGMIEAVALAPSGRLRCTL